MVNFNVGKGFGEERFLVARFRGFKVPITSERNFTYL